MQTSETSNAISPWEEPRLLTPDRRDDQRSSSTPHTSAVLPTAMRTLNRGQQTGPRTAGRQIQDLNIQHQPKESNPAFINTLSKEGDMAALMSPAHTLESDLLHRKGISSIPSLLLKTRACSNDPSQDSPERAAATGASQLPQEPAGMGGTRCCSSQSRTRRCGHWLWGEPAATEATQQLIIYDH